MAYVNSLSCNHHFCAYCVTKFLDNKVLASYNEEEYQIQEIQQEPIAKCPLCREPIRRFSPDVEYQSLIEKHMNISYVYEQRKFEMNLWKLQNMET